MHSHLFGVIRFWWVDNPVDESPRAVSTARIRFVFSGVCVANRALFVVDGPKLETQSLLLAATLRVNGPKGTRLFAMVPKGKADDILPLTRQMFDACEVELLQFDQPEGQWSKPYPHGNKLLACAALAGQRPETCGRTTFLDTDMVCLRDFTKDMTDPLRLYAVPEGVPTWGRDPEEWQRAYSFFGLSVPPERVNLTRRNRIEYLPYFNAGLVSYCNGPLGKSGLSFAESWLKTATELDHFCPIPNKRPWLDQIALPLTLYREAIGWQALPDTYNYSISNRSNERRILKSRIAHYHRAVHLAAVPRLVESALAACLSCLPPKHHDALFDLLAPVIYPSPEDTLREMRQSLAVRDQAECAPAASEATKASTSATGLPLAICATMADPTTQPSATPAMVRAASGVLMPKPTITGRSVERLMRATSGATSAAWAAAAPVIPVTET